MKIRTLFIFTLIFFSISSVIAYTVYSSVNMSSMAETQYERLFSDVAKNEAVAVNEYVRTISTAASTIGRDPQLTGFSLSDSSAASETAEYAQRYTSSEEGMSINCITVLNSSWEVVASTDEDFQLSFSDEQINAIKEQGSSNAAYISSYKDSMGDTTFDICVPYIASDRVILIYFSNSEIKNLSGSGNFPTNGHVVFVDTLNNVIDGDNLYTLDGNTSNLKAIKDTIISGKLQTAVEYSGGVNTTGIAYTVKSDCGWYVTSLAVASMAYNNSSSAYSTVFTMMIVLSFVFIALNIVVIFLLTKPLSQIEETLTKIHRGDHDSRIEINSKNEYGDIALSFNTLIENVVVSERRYRTIVEMSDDIVFEWNLKTNNVSFSNNFNKKFSFRANTDHFSDSFFMKGKMHADDVQRYRSDLERLEKGEEFKDNSYRWKNVYGDYIWISMRTSTIRDADGNVVKIIGVLSDIDRAKKGEMQLKKQASYDALTGVYNRETIENVIDEEIRKISDGGDGFAILFVDIDDFKIYNDEYSHATGDQVLRFVTDSITSIVEDFGFVGRYGGDEFIVCVRNISTNSPQRVAQDILTRLKEGFMGDNDVHLTVSVSIGIYEVSTSEKTVEQIISIADDAMYNIKKNGKGSFGIVSEQS